ncbi:MAG: RNA polymerase sigma factor [Candidatus Omnitrophota bacterium]
MNDISREILERAGEGDIQAFEEVYRQTSDFVYILAFKVTRNISDAQEVVQDVFMKIYHSLNGFQFRSAFKTWVYRITVNTAINHYRKAARESKDRLDYDGVIETIPDRRSTAEGAIKSDNSVLLAELLDKLIPEYKVCLILREIEGLSYQEIAAVLKIPINTVRTRLKRAREALLEMSGKGLMTDEL